MPKIFMILILVGGIGYLYLKKTEKPSAPPAPPVPPVMQAIPPTVLSEAEMEKVRRATMDADPSVRWAAIELLHRTRDPKALEILEKTLSIDTEPSVRKSALELLKLSDHPGRADDLVKALRDSEREIRSAALMALGEIGDPKTAPAVVQILYDVEPEVKLQALHTLGLIQAKQDAEHRRMQEEIRLAYEEALRKHEEQYGKAPPKKTVFHQEELGTQLPK